LLNVLCYQQFNVGVRKTAITTMEFTIETFHYMVVSEWREWSKAPRQDVFCQKVKF